MSALSMLSLAVSALGWTLLHFVWQAPIVGVLYALVRIVLPRGNPRYLAAMLAMLVLAALPVVTAWHELRLFVAPVDMAGVVVAGSSSPAIVQAAVTPIWAVLLDAALPWLVLAWAVGVGALGVRVFRQWRGLRAMLKAAECLPAWQARARQFADRMGLRRVVPVLASVRVATPTLIGWLRPAVVLPLAVLSCMPAAQIDLVLAHELAHLKRLDHIANLFQVVMETLFFYQPVVHWISRDSRNERELCCDSLALRVTGGERRDFVAALANLEMFRGGHADLALAASGGVLVERAWFIAGAAPERRHRHVRGNAMLMFAAVVVLGLGWLWWKDAAQQQRIASLLAANNASVLRFVAQDVMRAPAMLPMSLASANRDLPPVPYAKIVSLQDTVGMAPAAKLRLSTVDTPRLDLVFGRQHLAPVTAPVALAPVQDAQATNAATVAAPRPVHTVNPVYPSGALLAGISGQVVVEFALDAAGVPRDLQVVNSSNSSFNAPALQALAAWRFSPPALAGRRYRQAFTFRQDAEADEDAASARACLVTTGTHICRHVFDVDTDLHVSRPNG